MSLVVNQFGDDWSSQMGAYRFFKNEKTTEGTILEQSLSLQSEIDNQEELFVISDTSQINLNHLQKSLEDKSDLGVLNDGLTLGYSLHGSIVLNNKYESRGISNAITYARAFPQSEESKNTRSTKRDNLPIEQKESYRWLLGTRKSTEYLGNESRLTFIFDREGDIYQLLDEINKQGSKFIVRSQHNRQVKSEENRRIKLWDYIAQDPVNHTYTVSVPADSRGNKKRIATLGLKYKQVRIASPTHYSFETTNSDFLDITIVQATEILSKGQSKPENYINWNLLTNKEVKSVDQGLKIVENYSSRWCIEDVFRGMKNKGLQLDSVTLKTGKALRKISIMAFDISTVALKLRQARDGTSFIPIREVFDEQQVNCMEQLSPTLEGNTEKQKNLHEPKSLAWASWVIARLGGWAGYSSQRPPGITTMEKGLERFSNLFLGWSIRTP